MSDHSIRVSEEISPAEADLRTQAGLMVHLLVTHPTLLTQEELTRNISGETDESHDAIQRGVRDLIGFGLLHRHGQLILPTQAALRAFELW